MAEPTPSTSSENNACIQKKRSEAWFHKETAALIHIWRDDHVQKQLEEMCRNKFVWSDVSKKLKTYGFDRSWSQCKDKMRNLIAKYRKVKNDNNTSGNSFHTFQFYDEIDSILGTRELTQPTNVIESIQVIPEILQSTPEGLPPLLDNSILSEDGGTAETERSSSSASSKKSTLNSDGGTAETERSSSSASSKKSTLNSDLLEFIEKQDDKHEVMLFKLQKVFREQEEMIGEKEEQRRRKYDEEIDQKRRRYDEEVEQNRRKYEDELEMKRRKEESEEAERQRCHERKLFELLLKK
ncbi:Trihelix transcription factor GT-4 [Nymphon striatum]|nr:Trihelix transcription factor GT-4 [Nymphon striatum]